MSTIKYQITDPSTGEFTRFDDQQSAMEAFSKQVVELAMRYSLGCPYIKVEINDDGSETYFSDTGIIWEDWINSTTVQNILNQIRSGN